MAVSSILLTGLAGIIIFAAAIYVFGIPPELKRKLERSALKTMGENKASYVLKGKHSYLPQLTRESETGKTDVDDVCPDQISKIPDSDQRDVKDLKRSLGNLGGGATKNPLGEQAGEAADDLTKPFTGR
jgi:hypothetical protein